MAAEEKPIGEMIGRIFDDAQAYAHAEAELIKAKVEHRVLAYRTIAILLAVAAMVVFGAFLALVVTLVLWASSLIGPLGGGLAVTVVTMAVAGLLILFAKSRYEAIDDE